MNLGQITPNGRAALERVAEWLENGAQHVVVDATGREIGFFDMEYGAQETQCGTACCIAGAVYQFEGLTGKFPGSPDFFAEIGPQAKALIKGGLPSNEDEDDALDALFVPWDFFDHDAIDEFSSPQRAAKVIRHLLATGIVDWDIDVQENA